MATKMEDLELLQKAEAICEGIWALTTVFGRFEREVMGSQLIRAADSIGANIAESYGRYHYGEKIQFLYYARGSLFETKYWLRRCSNRQLVDNAQHSTLQIQLDELAHNINAYVNYLRTKRQTST